MRSGSDPVLDFVFVTVVGFVFACERECLDWWVVAEPAGVEIAGVSGGVDWEVSDSKGRPGQIDSVAEIVVVVKAVEMVGTVDSLEVLGGNGPLDWGYRSVGAIFVSRRRREQGGLGLGQSL